MARFRSALALLLSVLLVACSPGTTSSVRGPVVQRAGAFFPGNPNGQATAANSQPVVLPTSQVGAAIAQESGGNLATLAGIVSASKAAITSSQLPASLGGAAFTGSLSIVNGRPTTLNGTGVPANGVFVGSGPIALISSLFGNNSGSTVFAQGHNVSSCPPSNGAVPLYYSPTSVASGSPGAFTVSSSFGYTFSTGCCFVLSSTQYTYTAVSATTQPYVLLVN